jgi:hypothetical protein
VGSFSQMNNPPSGLVQFTPDGMCASKAWSRRRPAGSLTALHGIRADGRKVHDMYLREVKRPDESKYPGDFLKTRVTIPAAEAFRPLKEGGCPLVNG